MEKLANWITSNCRFAQVPRQALIPREIRNRIADGLSTICKTYWKSIPLKEMEKVLNANGVKMEQDFMLTGRDGQDNFELEYQGVKLPMTFLHLSWHKMDESGNWEITAYLT